MIINHIKKIILEKSWLRKVIIPIYLLCKYPFLIYKYGTVDPPQYFVFKQKKLIYLVNSKVAQTAITNTCGNSIKKEYSKIKETHLGEKTYKLSKKETDYYSFTFIRNPFERIVSCYYSKYISDKIKYKKEILDFDFYLLGYIKKDKGFATFIKKISHIPDFLADRHFKSQWALIYSHNKLSLDFIGRYENLEQDFEHIQTTFSLDPLPHLNPSGKNDWRDSFTQELVTLVAKRYKKDLETWYPNAEKELRTYLQKKKESN
jgi:hypothetical protein